MTTRPFYVAGEWRTGTGTLDVHSPYDDSLVATIGVPTDEDVEDAVVAATETFKESRHLPTYGRAEALMHISRGVADRVDELAESVAREGGKPLKWSKVEVTRAVSTFRWAAEETRRSGGELMRLDTEQSLGSRAGIIRPSSRCPSPFPRPALLTRTAPSAPRRAP